ncbi:MAG: NUDIX hydrolase [bacterium]|nr:NUDIX hydrolase [bacterium]
MREDLIRELEQFRPYNEQEARDCKLIIKHLQENDHIFSRENETAHMTASAWIVNSDRTKALMAYHNIYNSWSWLGGHADGEEDLLSVALREAREESGLCEVVPVSEDIFSVEILTVDGHEKRGQYVSSHLHLNVTYLLTADEDEVLQIKEDENSAVKWFPLEEAVASSTEEWFKQRIYTKLNAKLRAMESDRFI